MKTTISSTLACVVSLLLAAQPANAGGLSSPTAFTYQGRLEDNGVPANQDYCFIVRLFENVAGGEPIGPTLEVDHIDVVNGLFTLELDFGQQFATGGDRYLDLQVMDDDDCLDTSNLVQLAPRQRITATPLALHALRADVAVQAASAGLAEHAGFADLAAAARRLDAPDGAPTGAVSVDNDGNVGIRTLVVRTSGLVGVGTGAPAAPLHVVAQANDAEPGSGGFIQAGFTEGQNVVFDANEIMARDNGATSTLFLNNDGGNVSISATNAAGKVGIGTDAPGFTLDVRGPMQIANAGDGADLLWLSTERSWVFRQQGTGAETALKLESIGGGGNKHFIIQTILGGGVGIARTPTGNKFEVEGTASKTTAGSWLANSDAAIKTNVRTLTNALVVIARLRPVAFRYTEQYQAKHPSVKDQDYYNYIAQEFREVFPESVQDSGEDGLLQMDEYPAGVYAVAAIQELHAMVQEKACEIDDLAERERSKDQRLRELEERNAKLQARVARLEALLEGSQDAD